MFHLQDIDKTKLKVVGVENAAKLIKNGQRIHVHDKEGYEEILLTNKKLQMATETLETTPDCTIESTRVVNAPREVVYRAWSEPEHLKKWWGPAGFTNTFHEFDFREGGKWSFIMHGPDKGNYANECAFIKINNPSIIAWERFSKPIFQVVVTFDEVGVDQTRIVIKQIFNTAGECRKVKAFAGEKNEENFDRLEEELKNVQK